MTYQESLNFIHSLDKFGSRPGLERIQRLFCLHENISGKDLLSQNFIHVAGTNGKGSVCTLLSSVLTACGYRTGLFISPYIVDFKERIQINGKMISEQTLCKAIEYFKPKVEELNAEGIIITEFELLTAVAFYIFKQENCDVIVCEVGMGGLLDSTNLIKNPLCSVITKIDFDHTAVLGDTIEEIAHQKCGIIKENSLTVTAAQNNTALSIIKNTAQEKHNKLYLADDLVFDNIKQDLDGTAFVYNGESYICPLLGLHQIDNIKCALKTLTALDENQILNIDKENIKAGLKNVVHPARFELFKTTPIILLDGAHNKNGLSSFKESVNYYFNSDIQASKLSPSPENKRKTLILSMLKDKDSDSVDMLLDMFERIIITSIDNPRAMSPDELYQKLKHKAKNIEIVQNSKDALYRALSYQDDVFICGSLYLASQIRPHIVEYMKK